MAFRKYMVDLKRDGIIRDAHSAIFATTARPNPNESFEFRIHVGFWVRFRPALGFLRLLRAFDFKMVRNDDMRP